MRALLHGRRPLLVPTWDRLDVAQANVRVRSNEGLARQEDTDAVRDAAPRSRTTELQVEAHEGRRF
jgi:hypothetical protein